MNNSDIIEKISTIDERTKTSNFRINKLDEKIEVLNDVVVSIKEITIEIRCIRDDVVDAVSRLKELENIPRNRWNDMMKTMLTVVITAITTFVLIKLGIN